MTLSIVLWVILFIVVGGIVGWAQGGNVGEVGCSYLVLGAIVLMGLWGYRGLQERKALGQMVGFKDALSRFHDDCGRYPSSQEGLGALIRRPSDCQGWKTYLDGDEILKDPWGHEYVYSATTENAFRITSGGRQSDETSDDITVEEPSPEQPVGE